ncbi:MAG: hypothetical protein ACFCUQ_03935 [Kiloniellales bacterium]
MHHFGVLKALLLFALKALRIRAVVLMARPPRATARGESECLGIRRARPDDGRLFEAAGFAQTMLEAKLAEGPGWIRVVDSQLVGWNFIGTQQSKIADWLILRTGSDTAVWSTGTWVRHDLRGGGLLNTFAGYGAAWCLENGYGEILSWIELTNYASRRATAKLGCREIGRVTVLFRLMGVALVHDGRRWHLGRWTDSHPLVLSIAQIRKDHAGQTVGQGAESPRPSAPSGVR